jgi:zinc protease
MRTKPLCLLLTTIVGLAASACGQVPSHPSKIIYPPLGWKVPLGEPYRSVLDNGLVAYIAEDHSLPYFQLSGIVRYGSVRDPAEKEGISSLMTSLMRQGGTAAYNSDTLDAIIDLYALNVSVSASDTRVSFSCSCLSEYIDTCLYILSQVLFHPAFEEKKLKKQTSIFLEAIAHRFDNPDPVLNAAYEKAMYKDGPNSRIPFPETIGKIGRKDLVDLHKKVFRTENMIVAAAGNFDRAALARRLAGLFPKTAPVSSDTAYPVIAVKPLSKCVFVEKPVSQSYVRMGLPLFKRPNDDFYAVQILNEILGGEGFTSRLGTKVRSDEGLAYVVYSSAGSNYFFPATFFIEFQTKNETASRAMALSLAEVGRLRESGVTDDELAHAKKELIDGFPSMFRSPADIVSNYADNEFLGRPPDQFAKYPERINALTKADILAAAKKYLDPAGFTFTVVGDTAAVFKADTIAGFSLRSQKPRIVVGVPDSLFGLK